MLKTILALFVVFVVEPCSANANTLAAQKLIALSTSSAAMALNIRPE
jgi:hypothetical protein